MPREYIMRYTRPADLWNDALPLGNGRIGVMAYGHANIERLQLNEDSLWYGDFINRNNPKLKEALPEIRRLIFAGKIPEAEDLIQRYMIGAPASMRHYETMGELDIAVNELSPFDMNWLPQSDDVEDYENELDLMRGVQTVRWTRDGVRYTREVFVSHPDHVLCVRVRSSVPGAITLHAQFDRCMIYDMKVEDDRRPGKYRRGGDWAGMFLDENHTLDAVTLAARGNAGGTGFAMAVSMVTDGTVEDPYTQLHTSGASCVCLYLGAATKNREADPMAAALAAARAAKEKSFDEILARHVEDFEPMMRRCELRMGDEAGRTTDELLEAGRAPGGDPALAALYFTFGRYLIVSGGRQDSTALNLQGIWCKEFLPFWDSKYTTNINVQMNYWPVEMTNLSELHESLFDLIARVCERGKETARVMYGMRGSVTHHNTDYYGDSAPQDAYMASTSWPTGGAWLALHLWEHYRYTRDLEFLRQWQPVMREFALFFLDYLTPDGNGYLVTCPSVSPENRYLLPDGYDSPICAGPAMDNQILRELFGALIEADALLGLGDPLTAEFAAAREKLPPDQIGSRGQLLEWREEYAEMQPGMGHISHLYAAYPGYQINWLETPELLKAAGRSVDLRVEGGAGRGGWPLAWFICQYARQLDREKTGAAIAKMLVSSKTRNFFNGARVFQIDGNLGATAGIAEALMQSHTGIIHLLPALPLTWAEGEITGMIARGNVAVDIRWAEGKLVDAVLRPARTDKIALRTDLPCRIVTAEGEVAVETTAWGVTFDAAADKEYRVLPC
ncbi:MAG: glycoside hydrolase family 95 protein [Ruminococcaceae bacterium]|nr:glycoside hydrolase family 95 protein [Oscillospiraceae bacterium]